MSNTRTEIESSQSGANSAQALLVAHIELLQDGEPHSLGSKFFSGSLRFTPTHDPSRLTNLSFLDDWGKEPDASDAPFRQGTSASVLLNAAFVKVRGVLRGSRPPPGGLCDPNQQWQSG
jgi:hypothetical protein